MTVAAHPEGESGRVEALRDLEILDTLPEQAYDDLTQLAAEVCGVPVALVSLVDSDRQWFKSRVGIDADQTPRDHAFCAHAILQPDEVLVVEDARTDPRFSDNPLVTGAGGIRFYAGAPLVTGSGHALGTLCVIDRAPRKLSATQLASLRALARQVVTQLELRRMVRELERSRDELAALCGILERQIEATDRDLQRAELIQRSLLPHVAPTLQQCCVQSFYRPGRILGGDLFDVQVLDERHVAFVVADAAGHGLAAALLSVLFRQRLHLRDGSGRPRSPGAALVRANAALRAIHAPPGTFVTAVVGLLDTERQTMQLASAGHPPVLWLRGDARCETLAHTGPALGLFDDAQYPEHDLRMTAGDRLLLYTDGLLDLAPEGGASLEAIGASLLRIGRQDDALKRLYEELSEAGKRADRDDVTLLLVDLSAGTSCFHEADHDQEPAGVETDAGPDIRFGEAADATFLVLTGRVTWQQADAVLATALAVLDAQRELVVDLADCEYLDSTMLGTLHELTVRFDAAGGTLSLQRVPEALAAAFRELSLDAVLARIASADAPLPKVLEALPIAAGDLRRQQQRLLRAHQALAELSEQNRAAFAGVIDSLRDG